ncbi:MULTISPECIES: septal ring lytic transglycosylase RlpA family protein [Halomonas]|uniref:Endolytic peptidoglycan transglycosylase RlpA n=1 Tax=Halomonas halophila TaxID=29573 RepID=A0ABQ0U1X4_9GAMM|nr:MULTISPECIES: septal ring lytic transglycosylase RlpA family protein [Halomonas]MDR5888109.1 septal ring lytic transglycosylase RlpA family protein [Halomonas salina]WJY08630.1 septal ring lytic transglycosylase RlpA family protein [Halomonas halophila]GEK72265.1 endolytic peptidoglycan transglycosylase RlpA [Halomonas halophila]
MKAWWMPLLATLVLTGCAGGGGTAPAPSGQASVDDGAADDGGRYAMSSDAYPEEPPDVSQVPDAVPRVEPRSRAGNRSTYEVWGKTYHVLDDATGYERRGTASWYGEKFQGYATSNGEIYDMYKMSAAHRSLPLPSFARVTNLDNGRSVIVRVNDRGPFHSEREIDLSYAAAARLDILDHGTGRVRVEAIDPVAWQAEHGGGADDARAVASVEASVPTEPVDAAPARAPASEDAVYLQVAALGSAEGARELKVRLQDALSKPVRVASEAGLHRVQVGPLAGRTQIDPVRGELRRAGFDEAFVVDTRAD